MFEIIFYEDKNGNSEVIEYIRNLERKKNTNKESRINFRKTVAYFDALQELGTRVGEPVTKHLEGEIWELRPLKNRFLYAYYKDRKFIVLHHFVKKTKKNSKKRDRESKNEIRRLYKEARIV